MLLSSQALWHPKNSAVAHFWVMDHWLKTSALNYCFARAEKIYATSCLPNTHFLQFSRSTNKKYRDTGTRYILKIVLKYRYTKNKMYRGTLVGTFKYSFLPSYLSFGFTSDNYKFLHAVLICFY